MRNVLHKVKGFFRNKYVISALLVFGLGYFFLETGLEATSSTEFCTTCHVMNEAGATLAMSTHSNLACGDCHVPKDTVNKIRYKTVSGVSHIYHNTFDEQLPYHNSAKDSTREVVQQRCIDCHQSTISKIGHDFGRQCTDCHRQLPHNNKRLIEESNKMIQQHVQSAQ